MGLFTTQLNPAEDIQHHVPPYCFQFCSFECIQNTLRDEFLISSIFSILTIIISVYHITMHLRNFNNPFFQSKIIVIMIMAPFYCVTSMGSFIWPRAEVYFTLTRDCYEAILLFTFFYLIFSYLAYDREKDVMEDKKVYVIMIEYEKQVHHFFPFNYCQKPYQLTNWKKAKYFTYRCKKYVLQFLIIKLSTTVIMYIVYPNVVQHQNLDEVKGSYETVSSLVGWIVAISASYSLYYLVLFYHSLRRPLAPYSPLLKFLTIKITLFFTFWQRIMITIFQQDILECFDKSSSNYDSHEVISSLENTLICFEMFVMAIAGGMAYNYQNYVSSVATYKGSFTQVIKDTIRTFKKDSRLIKPKKFGFDSSHNQQIELKQIQPDSRISVTYEKNVRQDLQRLMVQDYF